MTRPAETEGELRRALLATAQRMQSTGLSAAATGNVSVRCGDGLLITPSGIDYAEMNAADAVLLDLEGQVVDNNARRPSTEWRIHCDIYRARLDFGAIVHSHSAHATAVACQRRAIPPFHYMVTRAGGHEIPCADYATFGTQALSEQVLAALDGYSGCLLANHGQLAAAADLAGALRLAWEIEELARQYCLTLQLGKPVLLEAEELERVADRFSDYGQKPTKNK